MTGGHLLEVRPRLDAETLECLQMLREERVVDIFRNTVGVVRNRRATCQRHVHRAVRRSLPNSIGQTRGYLAVGDHHPDDIVLFRGQNAVNPAQQRSQRQSHGTASLAERVLI